MWIIPNAIFCRKYKKDKMLSDFFKKNNLK